MPSRAFIFLMILSGILQLFGCSRSKTERIEYPPFIIERTHNYNSRFDINTASRVDDSRTHYKIYYQDELLKLPGSLEAHRGLAGLWKVHPLPNAPRPTLLAGSREVFLITAEEESYQVITVAEKRSDFASWQWLDSEEGQPGEKQEFYATDDTGKPLELSGGKLLLINRKYVLDLQDLSITAFNENALYVNEFSPGRLVGISPDKEQLVFMTRKYRGGDYEHALLVYNYKKAQTSLLHFDRNETRLYEPHKPRTDWLPTFFEWKEQSEGSLALVQKEWEKLPPWEGNFSSRDAYSLSPVKYEFLPVFAQFCKDYLALDDSSFGKSYYGEKEEYDLKLGDNRIEISFLDQVNTVYLSTSLLDEDEEGSIKIIRELGNAFNDKLRAGEHQDFFTSY